MKRFAVVFILVAVIVGALLYSMPREFCAVASKFGGVACIYCRSTSLPSTDMGGGRMVQCDSAALSDTLKLCSGVDGVSVAFNGTQDDLRLVIKGLALTDVVWQNAAGVVVACGHSPLIAGGVWLDGRLVNVQIAYSNGTVTVGNPLILGSY